MAAAHAYVEDGTILVMEHGRFRPAGRAEAVCRLAFAKTGSQQAEELRAALDATFNDYYFRAPRHGDLIACPYCDGGDCDHCGGERRLFASEIFSRSDDPCASHQQPPTDGVGGKQPSTETARPFTTESPMPGSSRSAASPMADGLKVPSSPLASGGSPARPIRKQANSSHPKSAAPKSMAGQPTLGANGHG